jgi:hypothetical protein
VAGRKCCNELLRHVANYASLFMGCCRAGRNVTATLIESQLNLHNMRLELGGGGVAVCHDTFITNELWASIRCCLTSTDFLQFVVSYEFSKDLLQVTDCSLL